MTRSFSPAYTVEPLGPQHDRQNFSCGVRELDLYLQRQARQDLDRRLAAVFVLTADSETIAGFYTFSAHSLLAADLPDASRKKLPRFPLLVTLLGRMALHQSFRRRRLGEHLLMHALERAWLGSQQVASWAVVVDAKAGALDFYLRYDLLALPDQPTRLFLPMQSIAKLFSP